MPPKNILVITNLYPYPWEPNRAAFNRQQFEKLAEISSVKLIVLVPWTSAFKNLSTLKATTVNNVEVDYCVYLYPPKVGRSLYPLFILLSLLTRSWSIKKFKPDCIFSSWAFPDAVAGGLLAKWLKIPTVIKVHGSDINMHSEIEARRVQIRRAMNRAGAVVAVSNDLRKKILQMGIAADKVHVLYNGINKSLFYPQDKDMARSLCAIDAARKVILFIGNLKTTKGCNLLLDAYVLLARKVDAVDLYYIGTGDQQQALRKKAVEFDLEPRVHFLGSLPHKVLAQWINASDVLVLPSMNEGVPNVILEAQACGTPVVATRVGGIPEVVSSDSGILVDYGNEAALCRALSEALDRKWDRHKISSSADALSWSENSARLYNIICSAAAG